jgi:hypothetical protein
MNRAELEENLRDILDGFQIEEDNYGQLIIYTSNIKDSEKLNEILPENQTEDADNEEDQTLIYTGLMDEDGELLPFVDDDSTPEGYTFSEFRDEWIDEDK